MMTTSSTSLFGGLVGLVVVVAILALVAGAALSGSDLLNPNTSAANAEAINRATQSKLEQEALDRKLQEARVEAELNRIRQETVARQRESEQALELAIQRQQHELAQVERRDQVINSVLPMMAVAMMIAVLIVSSGLTYYLIQSGRSRWGMAKAQSPRRVTNVDTWHDPAWRAQQINRARANEVAQHWAESARQATSKPAPGGNGQPPPTTEATKEPKS
jgi:hypothetical protein